MAKGQPCSNAPFTDAMNGNLAEMQETESMAKPTARARPLQPDWQASGLSLMLMCQCVLHGKFTYAQLLSEVSSPALASAMCG